MTQRPDLPDAPDSPDAPDAPSVRPAAGASGAPRPRRAVGDRAIRRATLIALGVGVVLDLALIVLAAVRFEPEALHGALIGSGLTLVIVLPTVAVALLGRRLAPLTMAATVLGSWALKMFIVILVLLAVRDLDGVDTRWLGLALLVGAVSAVLVEGVLIARSRQPLEVEPVEGAPEGSADPERQ